MREDRDQAELTFESFESSLVSNGLWSVLSRQAQLHSLGIKYSSSVDDELFQTLEAFTRISKLFVWFNPPNETPLNMLFSLKIL
jgi:hypothetical protein